MRVLVFGSISGTAVFHSYVIDLHICILFPLDTVVLFYTEMWRPHQYCWSEKAISFSGNLSKYVSPCRWCTSIYHLLINNSMSLGSKEFIMFCFAELRKWYLNKAGCFFTHTRRVSLFTTVGHTAFQLLASVTWHRQVMKTQVSVLDWSIPTQQWMKHVQNICICAWFAVEEKFSLAIQHI